MSFVINKSNYNLSKSNKVLNNSTGKKIYQECEQGPQGDQGPSR